MKDEADKLFEQAVWLQKLLNIERTKTKAAIEALSSIKSMIDYYPGGISQDTPLLGTIESVCYYTLQTIETESDSYNHIK